MFPTRRTDLVVHRTPTSLVVQDPATGAQHQLTAIGAAAFNACDGSRDVAAVIAAVRASFPDSEDRLVWSALDELGSAGLLAVRAAPPVGPLLDRRAILRTFMAGSAAAAAFGVMPTFGASAHAKAKGNEEEKQKGRYEERCKVSVDDRRKIEQREKMLDPAYKVREQSKKVALRERKESEVKARKSVGLDGDSGDWRAPVSIDSESGISIEGVVDIYSFQLTSGVDEKTGAVTCGSTFEVHVTAGPSGTTDEVLAAFAKIITDRDSGRSKALISFNDEPTFEARLIKADAGRTAFDQKGNATAAVVVCVCEHL